MQVGLGCPSNCDFCRDEGNTFLFSKSDKVAQQAAGIMQFVSQLTAELLSVLDFDSVSYRVELGSRRKDSVGRSA